MRIVLTVGLALAITLWASGLRARAAETAIETVFEKDIEYSNPDNQHLQLNLARPKQAAKAMPAVLCIHGGGFRAGKRDAYDALCLKLAQRGFVAATTSYRLAPKYQFPAAIYLSLIHI